MCDTGTIMAAKVGGGVMETVGSYFAASGQKTALKSQAAMADINARLSELTAQTALQRGQTEEQRSRLATANLKSGQRVALAANGVALDSDTSVNILTSTDVMGEIDANTINANAAREAWGYRTQSVNYKNEAMMARSSAKAINPFTSAGTTALTAAGDVAMTRYEMKKTGLVKADDWYSRVFGS